VSHRKKRVLIVKTGSAVTSVAARRGDFDGFIATGMGVAHEELLVCRVAEGEALPDPETVAAAVVTGSSAMVTERAAWSERTASWLREAGGGGLPLLGICFGHQLIAHAFGGRVDDNPRGRHIGTVDVALTEHASSDPLFGNLAERESVLHLPVSHKQSVLELPEGARLLATADRDPHHAYALGDSTWGVQFHPEFDADVVRGYVDERRPLIEAEGLDADAIKHRARDTEHGTELLKRFLTLVRNR